MITVNGNHSVDPVNSAYLGTFVVIATVNYGHGNTASGRFKVNVC